MKAENYLLGKGLRKVHQPKKRYNLTVEEIILFLNEFADARCGDKIKPIKT